MATFTEELDYLTKSGFLPNREYIALKRFTSAYQDPADLYNGILSIGLAPAIDVLAAGVYAMKAIWATLRAIGNLLILKPGDAASALKDAGIHFTLSLCLAALAPIDALTHSLELMTRVVSSWFSKNDSTYDLARQPGLFKKFSNTFGAFDNFLPSATYFRKSRFFSGYESGIDCLAQGAMPFLNFGLTSAFALYSALSAVNSALSCISNLIIGRPRHAMEDLQNLSVKTTLAISLAVMAPINALVETFIFFSKLPATWIAACSKSDTDEAAFTDTFSNDDSDVVVDAEQFRMSMS